MNKERLKQDFYEAVNEEWQKKQQKSPADKPATGGFQDLVDGIDQLLMGETDDLLAHPSKQSVFRKNETFPCILSTGKRL